MRKRTGKARINAESEAQRVLAESGLEGLPIDVYAIAEWLGVGVERADFEDDLSGVLISDGDGAAVIGVNWHHHSNRRRFTVAHELGHFLLHGGRTFVDKDTMVLFRDAKSRAGTDLQERQANQFAAALLMPSRAISDVLEGTGLDPAVEGSIEALAEQFEVSSTAMSFRLANLGYLEL